MDSKAKKILIDNPGSPFFGCTIRFSDLLSGNQIAIKKGNELIVCNDFTMPEKELKYLILPDDETLRKEMIKNLSEAMLSEDEKVIPGSFMLRYFEMY